MSRFARSFAFALTIFVVSFGLFCAQKTPFKIASLMS